MTKISCIFGTDNITIMTLKTASRIELIVSILYFIIVLPLIVIVFFFEFGFKVFNGLFDFFNNFGLMRFKHWLLLRTKEAKAGGTAQFYSINKSATPRFVYKFYKTLKDNDQQKRL